MLLADVGDPIWIPEGTFLMYEHFESTIEKAEAQFLPPLGIPVGDFAKQPVRGIFLERIITRNETYIKAYVDMYGERLVLESDVKDMIGDRTNVS